MDTLQHICEDFRRKIELAHEKGAFVDDVTFKHFPKGCCGLTCYLLSEYLLEYKAKTIYVWGTYSGQSHAWLVLKDKRVATPTQKYNLMPDSYKTFLQSYGQEVYDEPFVTINYKYEDIKDGLIIDITADQFGQSPVYLGPLDSFHRKFSFCSAHDCLGVSVDNGGYVDNMLKYLYGIITTIT